VDTDGGVGVGVSVDVDAGVDLEIDTGVNAGVDVVVAVDVYVYLNSCTAKRSFRRTNSNGLLSLFTGSRASPAPSAANAAAVSTQCALRWRWQ
jgi:hypothetical protein